MKLRYVLPLLITLLWLNHLSAQEFTTLNWNELRIDTLVPRHTQVIPLGNDYGQYHNYSARLEYPELVALSKPESEKLSLLVDSLPENPIIDCFLGISRREGQLDLSFIPLVQRNGQFYKILSYKIVVERTPKPSRLQSRATTSSSRYANSSLLSTGKWAKIRITESGIYQLTASALSRMGFTNPSRVKLYGYGGSMQNEALDADNDYDDLEEVPLYRESSGLLFYANGVTSWSDFSSNYVSEHVTNPYSSYGYYFLTEGDDPMTFPIDAAYTGSVAKSYTTFPANAIYENDSYAWYHSGRKLVDGTAFSGSRDISISLPGIVSSENATVTIASTASATTSTAFSVYANGTLLGTGSISANGSYSTAALTTRSYTTSDLLSESTTLRIQQARGRLDYIAINYIRSLSMNSTFLPFTHYGSESARFTLSNANSNTQIWRIGTKGSPMGRIEGVLTGNSLTINVPNANERYIAVNVNGSFPAPTFVEQVANQNLHAIEEEVDMVIIVPESGELTTEAERLAQAHVELDGLNVIVVRADQIYNEFSSGTPDATAYRRFMKMLYDRAEQIEQAPRYLLLFGDAAWDNRMLSSAWRGYSPSNFLLSFQSQESFSQTSSYIMEDYFGLLDDGEGVTLLREKSDLGIGRFPVRTAAEAKIMVDKTISYMKNEHAGAWKNTICFLGDDGDDNRHMSDARTVATRVASNHRDFKQELIYWDAYARESSATGHRYPAVQEKVQEVMQKGALMMNYSGHATVYTLSHEQVLTINDFKAFTSPRLPLWVTAACDVMPFDGQEENIGEVAVLNSQGAAWGFFGTTRTVYAAENRRLNTLFSDYVLQSDEEGNRYRVGDAIRMTKNMLVTSGSSLTDYTANKLHYALLGDPAVTLGSPTYKAIVDSLNGEAVVSGRLQNFAAGSIVRVKGHIVNEKGNTVPNFMGTVTSTIYDNESTITCFNHTGASSVFTYTDRDKVLFSGSDSVRAGEFSFSFPVPMDINYSEQSGLISLYAVSNDKLYEAQGSNHNLIFNGTSADLSPSTEGPKIFLYLNNPDFVDGGTVHSTPYFVAELEDEQGINTTGNGIGHDLQLIINGDANTTYTLNNHFDYEFGSYTKGRVTFSIPELSSGKHKLLFRAWDIQNNSSTAELNFVVDPSLRPQLFDVVATVNPAKTTTTFIVSYDRPNTEATFTLEVFDFAGRKHCEISERGASADGYYQLNWNLTNGGGFRLPAGVYLYRVGVACEGSKRSTKTKKIIILGNN